MIGRSGRAGKGDLTPDEVLRLQRTAGNQAVLRLLHAREAEEEHEPSAEKLVEAATPERHGSDHASEPPVVIPPVTAEQPPEPATNDTGQRAGEPLIAIPALDATAPVAPRPRLRLVPKSAAGESEGEATGVTEIASQEPAAPEVHRLRSSDEGGASVVTDYDEPEPVEAEASHPLLDDELPAFNAYAAGKKQRYGLLFAVNGGAFAVAKFMTEKHADPQVLGGLSLQWLAGLMMFFTTMMCIDIAAFGMKMRHAMGTRRYTLTVFDWPGWVVLGSMWLMLVAGWGLAGFGPR